MENRNYIIDRLTSRKVTAEEFDYDMLQAPPLSALLTPMDIYQLNQIAKSIKYSAKPALKYKMIDDIMRRRGFIKFVAGTNRVVYRFAEDNSFVVKVAYDAIGLGDNPAEFRNQFKLKPFCTKVFEVSPCGTVGVFERVNPITSREEYLSVAEDIFTLLNEWVLGEYILDDIGTNYFMNIGIRKGFGIVLLDFPYMFELDGNKLFCRAPNPMSETGCCDGIIDYDPGFNFLYCTKCGARYKARELSKEIENKNIIVKAEGGYKMKVTISRGNNVISTKTIGDYSEEVKAIPRKVNVNNEANVVKTNEVKVGKLVLNTTNDNTPKTDMKIKVTTSKSNTVVEEKPVVENTKGVNGVKSDDVIIAKAEPVVETKEEVVVAPVEESHDFDYYMEKAFELFDDIEEEDKDLLRDRLVQMFDIYNQPEPPINESLYEEAADESTNNELEELKADYENKLMNERKAYADNIAVAELKLSETTAKLEAAEAKITELEEKINTIPEKVVESPIEFMPEGAPILTDEEIINVIYDMDDLQAGNIFNLLFGPEGAYKITAVVKNNVYTEEIEGAGNLIFYDIMPQIKRVITPATDETELELSDVIYEDTLSEPLYFAFAPTTFIEPLNKCGYDVIMSSDNKDLQYSGFSYLNGTIINVKDIFQDQKSSKVLVAIDKDGKYVLNKNNEIIAINLIDNRNINSLSIVSKEWLDAKLAELEIPNEDNAPELPEEESGEEVFPEAVEEEEDPDSVEFPTAVDEEDTDDSVEIPTGVLPPNMTVNGVVEGE